MIETGYSTVYDSATDAYEEAESEAQGQKTSQPESALSQTPETSDHSTDANSPVITKSAPPPAVETSGPAPQQ